MEVRRGYKQTEVGLIPEIWECSNFTEVTDVITCGIAATPKYVTESQGYAFLSSTNIKDGRILWNNYKWIDKNLHKQLYRNNPPRRGDILYSRVGTIGEAAVIDVDFEFSIYVSLTLIKPKRGLDSSFLKHLLNSIPYKKRAKEQVYLGGGVGNLNVDVVRLYPILVPPLPEQEAIAGALGDADALIESLEQLLAKKRQLKQGAMQELLTGESRLPGFSGEWEVKRLGDVGDITSAGVDKKSRPGEVPVRLVNYLDVYRKDFLYSDDLNHWVTAPPHQARRCAVQKGDVFFTPSSETRDDIGISAVAMEDISDAAFSYHVVRLRLKEQWDLCFRTYAFKTRAFLSQAETLCDGNGTRYVISQGKFRSMTVQVPPVLEQTAIAAILSDMDAEIAALETKLTKARQLKQGMMQELLTGRIRLI